MKRCIVTDIRRMTPVSMRSWDAFKKDPSLALVDRRLLLRDIVRCWRHPRSRLRLLVQTLLNRWFISIPMDLCINQYAFVFGKKDCNYFTELARQLIEHPKISLKETHFYRFFQTIQAPTYTDLMSLHDDKLRTGLTKMPYGSYPWGAFDRREREMIIPTKFRDTTSYRARQNYMWYEIGPDLDALLENEFQQVKDLVRELARDGYRPGKMGFNFPPVSLLIAKSGTIRFVQADGAHRMAVLSAVGCERVLVRLDPERYPPIFESEAADWPYVRSGLLDEDMAIRIFRLYFELDGSERWRLLVS